MYAFVLEQSILWSPDDGSLRLIPLSLCWSTLASSLSKPVEHVGACDKQLHVPVTCAMVFFIRCVCPLWRSTPGVFSYQSDLCDSWGPLCFRLSV